MISVYKSPKTTEYYMAAASLRLSSSHHSTARNDVDEKVAAITRGYRVQLVGLLL